MRIANNKPFPHGILFARTAMMIALVVSPLIPFCAATASEATPPLAMPSMGAVPAPVASGGGAASSLGALPGGALPAVTSGPSVGVAPGGATAPLISGASDTSQVLGTALSGSPIANAPAPGAEMRKNVSAMEDKISDNAKNVVKHMDTSEPMTLEDLNSARQTVARIEAMIDVEKHMAELEKLRSERGGSAGHASGLASAIPASALAPMPLPTPTASPSPVGVTHSPLASTPVKPVEKEKPKPVLSNAEISRITGAEGKYSAVLRLANGDMKTVKAGDQVADHATVRWISSSSVVVEENGETHTLHIKNVDAIFSAMR